MVLFVTHSLDSGLLVPYVETEVSERGLENRFLLILGTCLYYKEVLVK